MTPDYSRIPRWMRPKDSIPLSTLLLQMLISGIPLMCSSIYLPAFNTIVSDLSTTPQHLVDTMTYYMVAFCISSLFVGPLIDMYGRRRPVLGGMILFAAGTLLCAFADTIDILLYGRLLQGLGGAVLPVASRAMLRDMLTDKAFVVIIGWHGIVVGLAPVIAPLLGAEITTFFGWRANFLLIEVACIVLWMIAFFRMWETHHPRLRTAPTPESMVLPMVRVAFNKKFLVVTVAISGMFMFVSLLIALTPFMVHEAGGSERYVGLFLLLFTVMTLVGRTVGIAALKKRPERYVWVGGTVIMTVGGASLLLAGAIWPMSVFGLIPGLLIFSFGSGMITPLGNKAAMSAVAGLGGSSAALLLFITVLFQAVGAWLGSFVLARGMPGPLAIGIVAAVTCAVTLHFAHRSERQFSAHSPKER